MNTMGQESKKEQLQAEIEQIRERLEQTVAQAKREVKATAEADRRNLERAQEKLKAIKDTVKHGWDNVTERAAGALLKLLK